MTNPPEPNPVEDLPSPNILHDLMLGGLVLFVFIIMALEFRLMEMILLAG